jgi:hypothetical protein
MRWTEESTFPGWVGAVRVLPDGEKWAAGYFGPPTVAFVTHERNGVWSPLRLGPGEADALAAASPSAVFAVGHNRDRFRAGDGTNWVLRFDGRHWHPVTPVPAGELTAARRSPWFARSFGLRVTDHSPAVFHWDGHQLRALPAPTRHANAVGDIFEIAAADSHHVWLAREHGISIWNGSRWHTVLRTPAPRHLYGDEMTWDLLDAESATDVWAIANGGGIKLGLTAHWDGQRWRIFPYPEVDHRGYRKTPEDVAAVSSSEAWLLLNYGGSILLRWDGTSWTKVKELPSLPNKRFRFGGISADRVHGLWLTAGSRYPRPTGTTIVYHGTCQ